MFWELELLLFYFSGENLPLSLWNASVPSRRRLEICPNPIHSSKSRGRPTFSTESSWVLPASLCHPHCWGAMSKTYIEFLVIYYLKWASCVAVLLPGHKLVQAGTASCTSAEPTRSSLKKSLIANFSLHLRTSAAPNLPWATEMLRTWWCCIASLCKNQCSSTWDFTTISGDSSNSLNLPCWSYYKDSTSLVVLKLHIALVWESSRFKSWSHCLLTIGLDEALDFFKPQYLYQENEINTKTPIIELACGVQLFFCPPPPLSSLPARPSPFPRAPWLLETGWVFGQHDLCHWKCSNAYLYPGCHTKPFSQH